MVIIGTIGPRRSTSEGTRSHRSRQYGLPFSTATWPSEYVILPEAGACKPIWEYHAKTLAWDLSGHHATDRAPELHSGCSLRSGSQCPLLSPCGSLRQPALADFTSARVGDYQYNPASAILPDQFSVR